MASSDQHQDFATTRWSLIAAIGESSSVESRDALASLCETYWYPLYAYVRRKGHQPAEAQDLTQAFFAELLEKDRFQLADQERGRFRSFLLASLNNFVANQWRRDKAQKRGGGSPHLSIDVAAGEARYRHEPSHDLTAERIFERRWAMTLLEHTISRLSDEYSLSDKVELFEALKGHLGQGTTTPYREVAERLGMSETAVKVAAHRMRKRCGQILREEISHTVDDPGAIDTELQQLFAAVEL
ncbi:MAG: sigma-70 family RNA polymerase sigma factor [Planctomycetaceae bacterium]|nr:sigma-70 family RNA polymerase sigma factor [Planctomycetaceae bacterium]MCB9939073.1 sigma-70 family RNA polymerase sigma factor [Planctomycetaceae bacterium]